MKPITSKFENKVTCNFSKTAFLLTLALLFIVQFTIAQKVITVDNRANSGADYTNLQTAVTAAFVGDTIQIHPSAVGYGHVTLNKRTILVGLSHNSANSKYGEKAIVANISVSNVSANSLITGLTISGIYGSSPSDCSGIKIVNNIITSRIELGATYYNNLVVEGNIFTNGWVNYGGNGMIVKNNIFDNTNNWAIQSFNNTNSFLNNIVISSTGNFANACAEPIVNNNIFILEGSIADVVLNNSTVVFNNNLTRNVQGFSVTALSGSNNLDNIDPQFVNAPFVSIGDYYNNDYNVTNGSAINGGTDGTDLGIFGANFVFDVQGRPDLFPYMNSLNIINSSVEAGQNINVEFTSKKKN